MALIANDGSVFAVQNTAELEKTIAAQGATQDVTVMFRVVVATTANITVTVDPSQLLSVAGMHRAPFISIDAFSNAPPANPATGALVVVGAAPAGSFVGLAHQFAQWTGLLWANATAVLGTVVFNVADGQYYRRTAGGWALFDATLTEKGLMSLADIFITANTTKTVGPASDFADLNTAFEWLKTKIICRTAYVTLQLTAGVHIIATPIVCDYAYMSRVRILGAAMLGADPTSATMAVTGSAPANRTANTATTLAALRAKYATELRCGANANFVVTGGLDLLDDVLLVGDGSVIDGLVTSGCKIRFGTVSVVGFGGDNIALEYNSTVDVLSVLTSTGAGGDGITAALSVISGYNVFSTSNTGVGIGMGHATNTFVSGLSRGNGLDGVRCLDGGSFALSGDFNSSNNADYGVLNANSNGRARGFVLTTSNNGIGIHTSANGCCDVGGIVASNNATYAFYARDGGHNIVTGYTAVGNPTLASPAVNVIGNHNAYNHS